MNSEEEFVLSDLERQVDWADREFGAVTLGDPRRTRRLVNSVQSMINKPGLSIPEFTGRWTDTKAFYGLLALPELTEETIFDAHREGTLARISAGSDSVVLAVQDTTTLNFSSHCELEGQGPIGNSKSITGLHAHSTLCVGAESGNILGLLGSKLYARDGEKRPGQTPGTRNREPIEQKESVRWLESFALAKAARDSLVEMAEENHAAPSIVSVGDREADIYELLVEAQNHREHGVGLLVRCQHNRKLEGQELQLWDTVANAELAGWVTVAVPAKSGLAQREIGLEVRFREVELAVPAHKRKYLGATESIRVTMIELREPQERGGIHWRLLTTLDVCDVHEAQKIAKWYSRRWQIEVMHRVLKTGCKVEQRQLRTMDRMKPMIALDLVVAVYLLSLITQSRSRPETPASEWLEPVELQALAAFHGLEPAEGKRITLSEAVRLIAKMGGHLGRKNDGAPGAEVVWRGLKQLETITRAWLIFLST